jgi:hypothetical protein
MCDLPITPRRVSVQRVNLPAVLGVSRNVGSAAEVLAESSVSVGIWEVNMNGSKAEWRDMDEWERRACDALVNVRFPVASAPKRAARNLTAQRASGKITNKQATALLWPLIARFRKQIPDKELVAYSAKAMGMSILREDSAVARVEGEREGRQPPS